MIEVEIRGKIENFDNTIKKFRKKAKFIKEKKRISFVYFRGQVNRDVREIRDDPVDLRARITNKQAELVLKYGQWGTEENRQEIVIPIKLENFEDSINFLKYLGWHTGVITLSDTFVFDYKGIEFSLVKNKIYDYFEAEILINKKGKIEESKKKILNAIKELNLKVIDEEEFMDFLNSLNNEKNLQFDFQKQSFKKIKKRFNEYF